MSENTVIYKSDNAIIKSIGAFVKHHRLEQNITQSQLSSDAMINRSTLSDIEHGRRCNLITLIQVLRSLNQLHVLEAFQIQPQVSPLKLAEMEMKRRQRASGSPNDDQQENSDW
jgi:transcriptional regulator with XRE-family HTH domain